MATILVSNSDQLVAAVAKAVGGDTIALASGTYAAVGFQDLKFSVPLTIMSADPSGKAVLTGLALTNSSGVLIKDVVMADQSASTLYDFQVKSSSNISFDHVLIRGEAGEAGYTAAPFMVRDSTNVSITNSEITHSRYGISLLDNNGVTISQNYFHDLRTDGVRGGGNSNVSISGNYFTNFYPAAGDHPDAIQFWTTNTSASASNISVTDNVIVRGSGTAMQGVFIRDESNALPYQNVLVKGNLVVGGMYNSIYVNNADNLSVVNNTVTGNADMAAWIRVNGATVLSGNVAQTYIVDGVNKLPTGNALTLAASDGGAALSSAWLAAHPELSAYMSTSPLFASLFALANVATGTPDPAAPSEPSAPVVSPAAPAAPAAAPETTINGTSGNDTLKAANVGDSVLNGGGGNDRFFGGVGETDMKGGAGNDTFYVNSSRDHVVELAGGGDDTVIATVNYRLTDNVESLRFGAEGLTGYGNALDNRMVGSAGADAMYGEGGNDALMGLNGDDILDGGAGADSLSGGLGSDKLYGGDGNDFLKGDEGNDWLYGGAGNDSLESGSGNDVMSGGSGADMFNFRASDLRGYDKIMDFSSAAGDKIGLSLIDANVLTTKDDPFKFIGTGSFTKHAGELRYSVTDAGALIQGDTNGDGVADLSILLANVTKLAHTDFTL
jgi:parallel beta-helix repeat protein